MKSVIVLICSLMMAMSSFGQSNSGMIKLGTTQKLPMRNGDVFKQDYSFNHGCVSGAGVFVISKTDSAFSICEGTVAAIFDVGDYISVTMRKRNLFYTYTQLSKSFVKQGDTMIKGSLIGLANKQKEDTYSLLLIIMNENAKFLIEDKVWAMIKDKDDSACMRERKFY